MRILRWAPLLMLVIVACGCGEGAAPATTATDGGATSAISTTLPATTVPATGTTVTTAGASTTLPATTSTTPPPAWSRVWLPGEVVGGPGVEVMFAVAGWAGGLVAVGQIGPLGKSDAGVWVSPDGVTWERLEDPEVLGGTGEQVMRAVVPWGGGLVAAGDSGPVGSRDVVVWRSDDGRDWRRVESPSFGGPGSQMVLALCVWEGGLAAVGGDFTGEFDAAVWTSADGETWQRSPHVPELFGGEGDQLLRAVSPWEGGLVAVGTDGINPQVLIVRSPDGAVWERAGEADPSLGSSAGVEMRGLVAWKGLLVAVGFDMSSNGVAVWRSEDAQEWERVPTPVPGSDTIQELYGITSFGEGLVAVGSVQLLGYTDAAVWESSDGSQWALVQLLSEVDDHHNDRQMWAVAPWGGGLVAVGQTHGCTATGPCDGLPDAAVWRFP